MYTTHHLFDLDFISAPNHSVFLNDIMDYPTHPEYSNKLPLLITPNADQLVKMNEATQQRLKKQLSQALFILPDGQPMIWFSRLVKKPLQARLTGSDLFPQFWEQVKQRNERILVIVSEEEVGRKLQETYENTTYYVPPFFDLASDSFNDVCQTVTEKIKQWQPRYVFVGISFPKQEEVSLAVHQALANQQIASPLFLCLGASAEFYVGLKKRAPLFFQKWGLEWLYRLIQEPKRMWRRYILGSGRLLVLFIKEYRKHS